MKKRRIFSLAERGGTPPPSRAKSAKTFLKVSLTRLRYNFDNILPLLTIPFLTILAASDTEVKVSSTLHRNAVRTILSDPRPSCTDNHHITCTNCATGNLSDPQISSGKSSSQGFGVFVNQIQQDSLSSCSVDR